jgi:hypothetical protein
MKKGRNHERDETHEKKSREQRLPSYIKNG